MSVESAEIVRQENEKNIIQTVKDLLNQYIFSEISVGKIARQAGVTSKTVNNIFGTRNSLLILAAISAYKEEHSMLCQLVNSSDFVEKSGLEQVMTLHYERAKFYRERPYVVNLISEIERLRLKDETEISQCGQYLALAATISSYYESPTKKGELDGSIKKDIQSEDIKSILFFSFGAIIQKLQTISLNELMNKEVDAYSIMRTVLKMVKEYIGA